MAIADFLDQIEPIVLAAESQKALDLAFAGKDNEHVVSWDNEPVVMSLTLRNAFFMIRASRRWQE